MASFHAPRRTAPKKGSCGARLKTDGSKKGKGLTSSKQFEMEVERVRPPATSAGGTAVPEASDYPWLSSHPPS